MSAPGTNDARAVDTAQYPAARPMEASRWRWREATFGGAFATYRGVGQLIRNFIKRPGKWGTVGSKTYGFLWQNLLEPEPDRLWSRAVSSDCTLEQDAGEEPLLGPFRDAASMLLESHAPQAQKSGLLLLSAVSAATPEATSFARRILESTPGHDESLVQAALRYAGWCWRDVTELEPLFDHFEGSDSSPEAAAAIAAAFIVRPGIPAQVPTSRLTAWLPRLQSLLGAREAGDNHALPPAYVVQALAYMLRHRSSSPDFLGPGSSHHSALATALRTTHHQLEQTVDTLSPKVRAGIRRLLHYLDGVGRGDVLIRALEEGDEPPLAPDPIPTDHNGSQRHQRGLMARPDKAHPIDPDDSQRAVIEAAPDCFLLVAAPPGAGKTAVACARIAWLARNGVPPASILMISFTRVAVQVFRDRIQRLAPESPDIHGVEITTLDSQAWHILRGLDDQASADQLLGGYDQNIRATIDRIAAGHEGILEWLRHYQHIVVDEAQDLVGQRAELVTAILKARAGSCGATLFGDRAQAIYGFTSDEDDAAHEARSFFDALEHAGLTPERRELTQIHRTSNPGLKRLFLDGRRPLDGEVAEPREAWGAARSEILSHADGEPGEFDDLVGEMLERDALVLFRTRAQVLMASSFLHRDGVRHRVRMSGTPQVIEPWIGFLLGEYTDPLLIREELEALWETNQDHVCVRGSGREFASAWNALREIAPGARGGVDLKRLRRHLSRTRPPVSVATAELGTCGPTLGTIHASKGREASDVILMLPKESHMREDSDFLEEGRVLYVGATRAIDRLRLGTSMACYSGRLDNGRVYRKGKKERRAQVEIGRDCDVDRLGSVSQQLLDKEDACRDLQRWLADNAESDQSLVAEDPQIGDFIYRIQTEDERSIGMFSKQLNTDLFSVATCCKIFNGKPPPKIHHLRMTGVTTVAVDADDPRLPELHEPYASSGLFLAPIVRGFSTIYFFTRRSGGQRW